MNDEILEEPDSSEAEAKLIQEIVGSEALGKACMDNPFDYAARLRTGEVIRFGGAKVINREWIHLVLDSYHSQPVANRLAFPAIRGVDVRLADIVWVMDAPEGS
jgi:hypothetical protein